MLHSSSPQLATRRLYEIPHSAVESSYKHHSLVNAASPLVGDLWLRLGRKPNIPGQSHAQSHASLTTENYRSSHASMASSPTVPTDASSESAVTHSACHSRHLDIKQNNIRQQPTICPVLFQPHRQRYMRAAWHSVQVWGIDQSSPLGPSMQHLAPTICCFAGLAMRFVRSIRSLWGALFGL